MVRSLGLGKEAVWRQRLLRFSKSGLTVVAFCRSEGVSPASFYEWQRRLGKRKGDGRVAAKRPKGSFVPVRLATAIAHVQSEPLVEIHLANGVRVCVPGSDVAALRTCIRVAWELHGRANASDRTLPVEEGSPC